MRNIPVKTGKDMEQAEAEESGPVRPVKRKLPDGHTGKEKRPRLLQMEIRIPKLQVPQDKLDKLCKLSAKQNQGLPVIDSKEKELCKLSAKQNQSLPVVESREKEEVPLITPVVPLITPVVPPITPVVPLRMPVVESPVRHRLSNLLSGSVSIHHEDDSVFYTRDQESVASFGNEKDDKVCDVPETLFPSPTPEDDQCITVECDPDVVSKTCMQVQETPDTESSLGESLTADADNLQESEEFVCEEVAENQAEDATEQSAPVEEITSSSVQTPDTDLSYVEAASFDGGLVDLVRNPDLRTGDFNVVMDAMLKHLSVESNAKAELEQRILELDAKNKELMTDCERLRDVVNELLPKQKVKTETVSRGVQINMDVSLRRERVVERLPSPDVVIASSSVGCQTSSEDASPLMAPIIQHKEVKSIACQTSSEMTREEVRPGIKNACQSDEPAMVPGTSLTNNQGRVPVRVQTVSPASTSFEASSDGGLYLRLPSGHVVVRPSAPSQSLQSSSLRTAQQAQTQLQTNTLGRRVAYLPVYNLPPRYTTPMPQTTRTPNASQTGPLRLGATAQYSKTNQAPAHPTVPLHHLSQDSSSWSVQTLNNQAQAVSQQGRFGVTNGCGQKRSPVNYSSTSTGQVPRSNSMQQGVNQRAMYQGSITQAWTLNTPSPLYQTAASYQNLPYSTGTVAQTAIRQPVQQPLPPSKLQTSQAIPPADIQYWNHSVHSYIKRVAVQNQFIGVNYSGNPRQPQASLPSNAVVSAQAPKNDAMSGHLFKPVASSAQQYVDLNSPLRQSGQDLAAHIPVISDTDRGPQVQTQNSYYDTHKEIRGRLSSEPRTENQRGAGNQNDTLHALLTHSSNTSQSQVASQQPLHFPQSRENTVARQSVTAFSNQRQTTSSLIVGQDQAVVAKNGFIQSSRSLAVFGGQWPEPPVSVQPCLETPGSRTATSHSLPGDVHKTPLISSDPAVSPVTGTPVFQPDPLDCTKTSSTRTGTLTVVAAPTNTHPDKKPPKIPSGALEDTVQRLVKLQKIICASEVSESEEPQWENNNDIVIEKTDASGNVSVPKCTKASSGNLDDLPLDEKPPKSGDSRDGVTEKAGSENTMNEVRMERANDTDKVEANQGYNHASSPKPAHGTKDREEHTGDTNDAHDILGICERPCDEVQWKKSSSAPAREASVETDRKLQTEDGLQATLGSGAVLKDAKLAAQCRSVSRLGDECYDDMKQRGQRDVSRITQETTVVNVDLDCLGSDDGVHQCMRSQTKDTKRSSSPEKSVTAQCSGCESEDIGSCGLQPSMETVPSRGELLDVPEDYATQPANQPDQSNGCINGGGEFQSVNELANSSQKESVEMMPLNRVTAILGEPVVVSTSNKLSSDLEGRKAVPSTHLKVTDETGFLHIAKVEGHRTQCKLESNGVSHVDAVTNLSGDRWKEHNCGDENGTLDGAFPKERFFSLNSVDYGSPGTSLPTISSSYSTSVPQKSDNFGVPLEDNAQLLVQPTLDQHVSSKEMVTKRLITEFSPSVTSNSEEEWNGQISNKENTVSSGPLPVTPSPANAVKGVPLLPKPRVTHGLVNNAVVIMWDVPQYSKVSDIVAFDLYVYIKEKQDSASQVDGARWVRIGRVKRLELPMACSLSHIIQKSAKYFFCVRAIGFYGQAGPYSNACGFELS